MKYLFKVLSRDTRAQEEIRLADSESRSDPYFGLKDESESSLARWSIESKGRTN